MNSQLDAIGSVAAGRGDAFKALQGAAEVVLSIVIEHYGRDVSLGWTLGPTHIKLVADLGASLDVDEYDYTKS